jgi:surface antigen
LAKKYRFVRFISQYNFKKLWHSFIQRKPALAHWYTNHFPAINLKKKMDGWDYAFNFSGELIAAILVLGVVGSTIFSFGLFGHDQDFSDDSLAAQLLSRHSGLNQALYAKQKSIKTFVVRNDGIINTASADDGALSSNITEDGEELTMDADIEDNALVKSNPDSVQSLISRQVQIYDTVAGDTLSSVARKFNLSTQTLKWTNSLPDDRLKPGWSLVIPPVDGVVIRISDPDMTLHDAISKYHGDVNEVMSYNALEDEEQMPEVGQFLIIPHGRVDAPAPAKTPGKAQKTFAPFVPISGSIAGNHKFAPGYCTDYVARKVPGITWGGDAKHWIAGAKRVGATVNMNPTVGSILVTNENSRYGHVAVIVAVDGNSFTIKEWNYAGRYKETTRNFTLGDSRIKGIIHTNK